MMPVLDFNLTFERGGQIFRYAGRAGDEILGIVGPSGAGKTTFLRLLAGLETPSAGSVVLGGRQLFNAGTGVDRPPGERRIGMVFQDARLFPHLTVERNILFGAPRSGRSLLRRSRSLGMKAGHRSLVDMLGIGPLLPRLPADLSGGEKQRVALARALAALPSCLLLDEPFGALDTDMREYLLQVLVDLRSALEIPMILVSHNETDLARSADRILRIEDGRLSTIAADRRFREAVS